MNRQWEPKDMTRDEGGPKPATRAAETRRERLAAELRANLSKRKAQARARGSRKPETGDGETGGRQHSRG
jgi:hypothetical protein